MYRVLHDERRDRSQAVLHEKVRITVVLPITRELSMYPDNVRHSLFVSFSECTVRLPFPPYL